MAAALEAGVSRLFRIGGAHAIAALAYGTTTIPRVDKIVGPGNKYVAAAKSIVAADCAIDFLAGPTEIVIIASSGRPDWIRQAAPSSSSRSLRTAPSSSSVRPTTRSRWRTASPPNILWSIGSR
jgi:histidinol dehydrogenase